MSPELEPAEKNRGRQPPAVWALAAFIGLAGLAPHFFWSLENHQFSWFFNSYDEGFYGWLTLKEVIISRLLATGVMRTLYLLAGGNTQATMALADFFLPFAATVAACYALRPLFRRTIPLLAAATFVLIAPEILALRSTFAPHAGWYDWLTRHAVPFFGGPGGWLQIDNRTATFWMFRTPEPQVSLVVAFALVGVTLRLIRGLGDPYKLSAWLLVWSVLLGLGYMFTALSLAGAFLVFGVLAFRRNRAPALRIGFSGLVILAVCLAASLAASSQLGGDKFLFPSRAPVLMLSVWAGLIAALLLAVRCLRQRQVGPLPAFGFALALAPLGIANQQLLTGRMIYLMNFENFGLAHLAAFALLLAGVNHATPPPARAHPAGRWWAPLGATVILLAGLGVIGRSQWLSYQSYLEENRHTESYVRAARSLVPSDSPDALVCGDFFVSDILALKLGYRPPYVVARDTTFLRPVKRLASAAEFPANGLKPRRALFRYLAACSVTAPEFARRLNAVIDPADPNWQDRFMLGAFLYNQADFWAPMTQARDLRSSWLVEQRSRLVGEYEAFLKTPDPEFTPTLLLLPESFPEPAPSPQWRASVAGRDLGRPDYPLKAYRLTAAPAR